MIFNEEQINIIYDKLYDWLAVHTPGSRCRKSRLKDCQKKVWEPILQAIKKLAVSPILSNEEKDFLNMVIYNGPIFRIQTYNSRYKGYIYEMEYYQSWSKSLEGVNNVSNFDNTVLLIVGNSVNGIDIFGMLTYMLKYDKISQIDDYKNPKDLLSYKEEKEIVYPVQLKNIERVVAVEKDDVNDWINHCTNIPKEKWTRKSLY